MRGLQQLLADVPSEGLEARLEWVERFVAWRWDPTPALGLMEPMKPEAPAVVTRLALLQNRGIFLPSAQAPPRGKREAAAGQPRDLTVLLNRAVLR